MKLLKFSNNTGKKIKSSVGIAQAIQKCATHGLKGKRALFSCAKGYSVGGYSGGVKTVTDINKQIAAIKKLVS